MCVQRSELSNGNHDLDKGIVERVGTWCGRLSTHQNITDVSFALPKRQETGYRHAWYSMGSDGTWERQPLAIRECQRTGFKKPDEDSVREEGYPPERTITLCSASNSGTRPENLCTWPVVS